MEITLELDQSVQHRFDCFCKKVIKYMTREIYRARQQQADREVCFSEMTYAELDELHCEDEYFNKEHTFNVFGYEINIKNTVLVSALAALPEDRRHIILASFFLDMNDREIAEAMNLVRRTVAYHRTSSLAKLQELLGGIEYENFK